jgi:hypothetical protein
MESVERRVIPFIERQTYIVGGRGERGASNGRYNHPLRLKKKKGEKVSSFESPRQHFPRIGIFDYEPVSFVDTYPTGSTITLLIEIRKKDVWLARVHDNELRCVQGHVALHLKPGLHLKSWLRSYSSCLCPSSQIAAMRFLSE